MADRTTRQEDMELRELIISESDFYIDAQRILDWVEENFPPDRVYTDEILGKWATENGYILSE